MSDIWQSHNDATIHAKKPMFVCTISYTATSENYGLTIAGSEPDLVKYTPAADAEFLHYGRCVCIPSVPATPDGKPTPAVITRAALKLSSIPMLVVDAGSKIKPQIPYVSFCLEPGGDISKQNAMSVAHVKRALEYGKLFASQLARTCDLLVLGESIPAGTTTALAVLTAFGIDARFKVSSSMPNNPHEQKNVILASAFSRAGTINRSPVEIISIFGDPMIPTLAGMVTGAFSQNCQVLLAGGTQMAAVVAFLKALGENYSNVAIGTTKYVVNDESADLVGLVRTVDPVLPIFACDLHLAESVKPGLQAYSQGFVKEGAGAGGCSIAAMLKNDSLDGREIMREAEKEYEKHIEVAIKKQKENEKLR